MPISDTVLPVDIVCAPEWWHENGGISFDRDFFFHPARRVEDERKMERLLYERWGRFALGEHREEERPEVGAVHLAAGFFIPEMLGCEVLYTEKHPPQVKPANMTGIDIDPGEAFKSGAFRAFDNMTSELKAGYGVLHGDVNWGGILNLALDLRGQEFFIDMVTDPESAQEGLARIAEILEKFADGIQAMTGTSSVSVNRNVRNLARPVFLHSECSHTMISQQDYEKFLLPFDIEWSKRHRPFGIHYCGADPHRHVVQLAKIPHLDFLDVGWGGDLKVLREYLPDTFLNIRLSPVELARSEVDDIHDTIVRLVTDSGDPRLTGVCCINIDDTVTDDKITAIFETVEELRDRYDKNRLTTRTRGKI